jgi:hypothetical protein
VRGPGATIDVVVALHPCLRLAGLAALDAPPAAALLIPRCRAVHTWGMRFALDLAWIDWPPRTGQAVVLDLRPGLPPRRFAATAARGALAVLELPAGGAASAGIDRAGTAVTVTGPWTSRSG